MDEGSSTTETSQSTHEAVTEAMASMNLPPLPPQMAANRAKKDSDFMAELNRVPLFMTELDETDGQGGENIALEALKALNYEGTKAEVAANFKEQGNDCAKAKKWPDAREYYAKALEALKGQVPVHQELDGEQVVVDLEQEAKKEKDLEEACLVNRALCNLELHNYRSCMLDCAAALKMNPNNVKAFYRSASACLALDKIPQAKDAAGRGLGIDPANAAMRSLVARIATRESEIKSRDMRREEEEARRVQESIALRDAYKKRNLKSRKTDKPPNLEDAEPSLADPIDPKSELSLPVLILYPLASQTDFIKSFDESTTMNDHLAYLLPTPWDGSNEYTPEQVDCYMPTAASGLIKVGKKLTLTKVLSSGKLELVDGLLNVFVVPSAKATEWIDDYKITKGQRR